jgi:hypothetical protein
VHIKQKEEASGCSTEESDRGGVENAEEVTGRRGKDERERKEMNERVKRAHYISSFHWNHRRPSAGCHMDG